MGEPAKMPEPERPPEPEISTKLLPTSGMAITSLVLSIVGIIFSLVPGFGVLMSVLAIIFGAFGISQTNRKIRRGAGMAIAGLVLGIVGLLIFIFARVAV